MGALLIFWLAGAWSNTAPVSGDAIKDVNGVTITVGATVKLVGVVTAINNMDLHFQDVAIALKYPTGTGVTSHGTVSAYPLQLVVGS